MMCKNGSPPANIIFDADIKCPLCQASSYDLVRSHKLIAEHVVHKLLCHDCGLIYSYPNLPPEKLRKLHAKRVIGTVKPNIRLAYRSAIRALPRFNRIRSIVKNHKDIKIVDIGARTGEFIYLLQSKGYLVHGIETNKEFINYAASEYGLALEQQFFDEITLIEDSIDLITCYHQLHLVADPLLFLQKMFNSLKVGGYLNLEVPNIEANHRPTQQKLKAKNLHIFNLHTIQSMAKLAGFTVKNAILIPGTFHINLILKKIPLEQRNQMAAKNCFRNPKNYALVRNLVMGYRSLEYLVSIAPYSKLLNKIKRHFREYQQLRTYSSAKQVVNTLFNRR